MKTVGFAVIIGVVVLLGGYGWRQKNAADREYAVAIPAEASALGLGAASACPQADSAEIGRIAAEFQKLLREDARTAFRANELIAKFSADFKEGRARQRAGEDLIACSTANLSPYKQLLLRLASRPANQQ